MSDIPRDVKAPIPQEQVSSPTLQLYTYKFFSAQAAAARKALIPAFVLPLIYNAILLWACLALFFGSLLDNNDVSKIRVVAVNLDTGVFGNGLIQGIQRSLKVSNHHLDWEFMTTSVGHDDLSSMNMVLEEEAWAVLHVPANVSSRIHDALTENESSYDPMSAATLYFASARNHVTTLAVTVSAVMGLVDSILPELAINSTSTFLQSIANDTGSLTTALQCPQCLAAPFAIRQVDLIPFSSPVAFGTMSTGLIFVSVTIHWNKLSTA